MAGGLHSEYNFKFRLANFEAVELVPAIYSEPLQTGKGLVEATVRAESKKNKLRQKQMQMHYRQGYEDRSCSALTTELNHFKVHHTVHFFKDVKEK